MYIEDKKIELIYYVECFDRNLYIYLNKNDVERAKHFLNEAYNEWMESDICDCLEEYLINVIKSSGIDCICKCEGDDENVHSYVKGASKTYPL